MYNNRGMIYCVFRTFYCNLVIVKNVLCDWNEGVSILEFRQLTIKPLEDMAFGERIPSAVTVESHVLLPNDTRVGLIVY